jgi:hypothetical protein
MPKESLVHVRKHDVKQHVAICVFAFMQRKALQRKALQATDHIRLDASQGLPLGEHNNGQSGLLTHDNNSA